MSRQYFQDAPYCDPPIANLAAIVATTETALWSAPLFTPIPALDARAAKMYRLTAGGILSTAATGTLTITPRYGTSTGGVTLGASAAQTVPISISNISWFMEALLTVRTIGATGSATSTVMCNGCFWSGGTVATAGSAFVVPFGGTSGTVDTSAIAGLFIGWTLSVAGSVTPQQVAWQSLN